MTEAWPLETPARVCIVDDDATALAATAATLRGEFDVMVARSGPDALSLINRHPPDVVLLDVDMPGLDGMAVCRILKADPLTEPLPVVFLTAHSDEATEVRGLAAGAADFIAKPPRGPAVVARVRNLVRLKRLAERLRRESQTDGLTGLQNRAQFDRMLPQELLRAQRQGRPLSLLMVDVDHFKAYNDHHGHLAGDGALRQVAQALKTATRRAGDLACRYGGEEFALIVPATDRAAACRLAGTLRATLAALALPHGASPTAAHVTLSIGVATTCPLPPVAAAGAVGGPGGGAGEPGEGGRPAEALQAGLLAAADAALYAAKRHGRDRAWVHGPQGPEPVAA